MSNVDKNSPFSSAPHSVDPVESSLLVSVIIPVYNDQSGLNNCLRALENQSLRYQQFEVIVVDNSSQPKMELTKKAELNCILEDCEKPGSYAARNVGLQIANGEVIAFLDADCLPEEDWLKQGLAAVQSAPLKTLVGGEVKLTISERPTAVELYQCLTGFGQQYNIEQKSFTATANLFARREQVLLIGRFNEDLLSGGDREWSWRARAIGFSIKFSPNTQVATAPRKSLGAAIKQARRIAGGRYHFKKLSEVDFPGNIADLAPRRSAWEATWWLLNHADLSIIDRSRVLSVAITLKLVQMIETIRLKKGASPERC
jgi:glycosyltransferase involved in cell wall biosynthesis